MPATTIGFAIEDADRDRLQHLVDRFSGGNRSAFLRVAIELAERYAHAQDLISVQAYGEQRLAARDYTEADIPTVVSKALRHPSTEAIAQAKLIVADLQTRRRPARSGRDVSQSAAAAAYRRSAGSSAGRGS